MLRTFHLRSIAGLQQALLNRRYTYPSIERLMRDECDFISAQILRQALHRKVVFMASAFMHPRGITNGDVGRQIDGIGQSSILGPEQDQEADYTRLWCNPRLMFHLGM